MWHACSVGHTTGQTDELAARVVGARPATPVATAADLEHQTAVPTVAAAPTMWLVLQQYTTSFHNDPTAAAGQPTDWQPWHR